MIPSFIISTQQQQQQEQQQQQQQYHLYCFSRRRRQRNCCKLNSTTFPLLLLLTPQQQQKHTLLLYCQQQRRLLYNNKNRYNTTIFLTQGLVFVYLCMIMMMIVTLPTSFMIKTISTTTSSSSSSSHIQFCSAYYINTVATTKKSIRATTKYNQYDNYYSSSSMIRLKQKFVDDQLHYHLGFVLGFVSPTRTTTTTTVGTTTRLYSNTPWNERQRIRKDTSNNNEYETDASSSSVVKLLGGGGYHRPIVQWYPGHIAKAERALANTMKAVDVVLEVRDARIPAATTAEHLLDISSTSNNANSWYNQKPRIIVLTHVDSIPRLALSSWYNTLLQNHNMSTSNIKTPSGNYTKEYYKQQQQQQQMMIVQNDNTNEKNDVVLSPNQLIQNVASQVETVRIQYTPTVSLSTPTSAAKAIAKSRRMSYKSSSSSSISKLPRSTISSSSSNTNNLVQIQNQQQLDNNVKAIIYVNAKMGMGIHGLKRSIIAAGQYIQQRRTSRGLGYRPLRVGIIGYPNVGKSALINKLIGQRRCRTANTPGVTRSLQWIRIKHDSSSSSSSSTGSSTSSGSTTTKHNEFELLDSPGIIPAVLKDQSDAMLLAACNCIGTASYDNQMVAAYLCEWILAVHTLQYQKYVAPLWRMKCIERYKFDPITIAKPKQYFSHEIPDHESDNKDVMTTDSKNNHPRLTGEDMLYIVADNTCQGDPEDAARKILQDFRAGRMGPICLQVAPNIHTTTTTTSATKIQSKNNENVQQLVPLTSDEIMQYEANQLREIMNDPDDIVWQIEKQQRQQEQKEIEIANALQTIQARGIPLPPRQQQQQPSRLLVDTASDIDSISLSLSAQQSLNMDDENITEEMGTDTITINESKTTTSQTTSNKRTKESKLPPSQIGKGLFDGW